MTWINNRQSELGIILERLLNSTEYAFNPSLRSSLPNAPGIYVISIIGHNEGTYIRAGRTDASLRQRIYGNHFMGNQNGNLRKQLVRDGIVGDISDTKEWIQKNCRAQYLTIEDRTIRRWAEHFMLSILQPKYCD